MGVPILRFPARALIIGAATAGPVLEPWFIRSSKEAAFVFESGELVSAYQDAMPRLNGLEGLFLMRIETPVDQDDRYAKLAEAYQLLEGNAFSVVVPLGVTIDSPADGITPLMQLLQNMSPTGEGMAMIGTEQVDVDLLLANERMQAIQALEDAFRLVVWPGSVLCLDDGGEPRTQSPAVVSLGAVAGATPGFGLFGKSLPWVYKIQNQFAAEQRAALGQAGYSIVNETRVRGPYIDQAVTASLSRLHYLDDALGFQDTLSSVKEELVGNPLNLGEIEGRLRAELDRKVQSGVLLGYDLALSSPAYEHVLAEVALRLNHSVIRLTTGVVASG